MPGFHLNKHNLVELELLVSGPAELWNTKWWAERRDGKAHTWLSPHIEAAAVVEWVVE